MDTTTFKIYETHRRFGLDREYWVVEIRTAASTITHGFFTNAQAVEYVRGFIGDAS